MSKVRRSRWGRSLALAAVAPLAVGSFAGAQTPAAAPPALSIPPAAAETVEMPALSLAQAATALAVLRAADAHDAKTVRLLVPAAAGASRHHSPASEECVLLAESVHGSAARRSPRALPDTPRGPRVNPFSEQARRRPAFSYCKNVRLAAFGRTRDIAF